MPASRFCSTSRKAKPMATPPMPSRLNRSAAETEGKATEAATRNETRMVTPPAMRPSTEAEPAMRPAVPRPGAQRRGRPGDEQAEAEQDEGDGEPG